ncbi:flippase [Neobacillus niacini]|uniref:flippase n=1 Tax=Neobacillus niacini TaxID=86668 RepID=UPI00203B4317|nr:oligosaccharide flippase family protein [Neobacillus niacini]MCM3693202.1 oligosaccharide flippase family protein [Neobacillus niacini]
MTNVISIKKNLMWNSIRIGTGYIFPVISFAYVSRILGASGIGTVSYVYTIVSYFTMFALLGIPTYALREGAKFRNDIVMLSKFVSEMYIIIIGTTVISLGLYSFLIFNNDFAEYRTLLLIMGLVIPCSSIGASWYFQIIEDYKRISLQAILFQIISLVLIFTFIKTSADVIKYGAIHILGTVGSNVLYFVTVQKRIKLFQSNNYNIIRHIKPILIIFGMTIASTIYLSFDSIMLGYMIGDEAVGLYAVALKLISVVIALIASLNGVILARLSVYINNNNLEKFRELLSNAFNFIFMLAVPASFGLYALSEQLVSLFSGAEYMESAEILRLLSINVILSPINGLIAYQVFMPYGKEMYSLIATIVGSLINFTLNLIFIPIFQQNGAAITTIIAELCVFSICIFYASKLTNMKLYFRNLYQYILAAMPIILIGYITSKLVNNMVLQTCIVVTLGFFTYFTLLKLQKNDFLLTVIRNVYKRKL